MNINCIAFNLKLCVDLSYQMLCRFYGANSQSNHTAVLFKTASDTEFAFCFINVTENDSTTNMSDMEYINNCMQISDHFKTGCWF